MPKAGRPLSCPSAQPDMEDARIFGVIGGTAEEPQVSYLKADAQVGDELMQSLGEVDPITVFRYAARCENGRCAQFANGRCGLGKRIATELPAVVDRLPSCQIRATCRWFAEEGEGACFRCPQVVTLVPDIHSPLGKIADMDD